MNFRNAVTGQNSAPAANNNQSSNPLNNIPLAPRIEKIINDLTNVRNPIKNFLTTDEPKFIEGLRKYINEISTNLAQLNIEAEADRIAGKTVQLRQASDQLRQQVQQLSDQNTQITQDRDKLNLVNQQLSNDNQQLAQRSQQLNDDNAIKEQTIKDKEQIIIDATNALGRFNDIINEIQTEANDIQKKTQAYNDVNSSLDALSELVNLKLRAYQKLQGLEQQGGMRSKGKRRTKKYKKMRGGYSYSSAGYEGAQEIVVTSSRSARSRSARSKRQSKRRPKTI